jgi:hypothetical protein
MLRRPGRGGAAAPRTCGRAHAVRALVLLFVVSVAALLSAALARAAALARHSAAAGRDLRAGSAAGALLAAAARPPPAADDPNAAPLLPVTRQVETLAVAPTWPGAAPPPSPPAGGREWTPLAHVNDFSGPASPLFVIYGAQESWAAYISVQYHHLFRLLERAHGWRVFTPPYPLTTWDAVAAHVTAACDGRVPDVLLFVESFDVLAGLGGDRAASPLAPGASSLWLWMNDIHSRSNDAHVAVAVADVIVTPYAYAVDRLLVPPAGLLVPPSRRPLSAKALWMPHGASSLFQLPLRPYASTDRRVLLSGATSALWYPYRAMVEARVRACEGSALDAVLGGPELREALSGTKCDSRFTQVAHPGYPYERGFAAYNRSADTGAGYAATLGRHVACITDGLTHSYAVAKLFEIPAAGCLLLANAELTPVLAALGFADGVHFLSYTADTLDAVVDAVLDPANAAAVDAIRGQGQALVWARHTVSHRAAAMHEAAVQRTAAAALARGAAAAGSASGAAR